MLKAVLQGEPTKMQVPKNSTGWHLRDTLNSWVLLLRCFRMQITRDAFVVFGRVNLI